MKRRRFLAAIGASLGGAMFSGCLEKARSADRPRQSPTSDSFETPAPDSPDEPGTGSSGTSTPESPNALDDPGTPTPPSYEDAATEPDPDLPIVVVNRHDATHELVLIVARESGEVVYEATHEVEPGTDREIYNLEAATPDGVETFTVEASIHDQTESVTVKTSVCYGSVLVRITKNGEPGLAYSVC